ncbi:MAG: hypothetical protein HN849_32945 [Victivallales bacterium]|jgi:hypothetical protein|nr:hypothetical protein [Victivallales bacterium]MBT7164778.1 hypothetical protein [Victivallales bacterium]MBT7304389.1 hypothetical protein [Victivallales bacterium]
MLAPDMPQECSEIAFDKFYRHGHFRELLNWHGGYGGPRISGHRLK